MLLTYLLSQLSHNSLKLSFMNIQCLHSNFVDCESFLESSSLDILALCEKDLDESIDSGNFSVRGYNSVLNNSVLNKGKSAILPLFNGLEVLSSASDKAKLFAKNFDMMVFFTNPSLMEFVYRHLVLFGHFPVIQGFK